MNEDKETGLIQVYTGNGKGKSTAAFGLALRAAGCGLNTVIIQFMKKGEWYGEINAISHLPLVEIFSFGGEGFIKKGQKPGPTHLQKAREALAKTREVMQEGKANILVLDEINNALYYELVSEAEVRELLALKPAQLELVLTGRNAPEFLLEAADLVTEMREVKHPYQQGVQARRGIEY